MLMPRRHRRKKSDDNIIFLLAIAAVLILLPASIDNGDGSVFTSRLAVFLLIVLISALSIAGILFYKTYRQREALRQLDLAAVDLMTGHDFERWVGEQLRLRDYKIVFTPINDYGVDIVASKDGLKTAVQVKRYTRVLDQKPVREAVAGMLHYKCSKSMVVTNSRFTKAAQALAKSNRCELIDRDRLAGWLNNTS